MSKPSNTNSNQKKVRQKKKKTLDPAFKRILIFGGIALTVLIAFTFAQRTGRIPFFTQNFLSLVVVIAIAIQALIYWQQRKIMERAADYTKIGERAYIGIKAASLEDFAIGKRPLLRIVLLNGGRTPAWNVNLGAKFRIKTELPPDRPDVLTSESNILPGGVDHSLGVQMQGVVTPEIFKAVVDGPEKLFVIGEVRFKDAWNNKRKFRFTLVYVPNKNAFWNYQKERDSKTAKEKTE